MHMRAILSAAIALAVVFGSAGAGPTIAPTAVTVAGLQLALSTDKSLYRVGEDPRVTITFRNQSTHEAEGNFQYFWVALIGTNGAVIEPNAFPTHVALLGGPPGNSMTIVKSGADLPIYGTTLSTWGYKLTTPGTFILRTTSYVWVDAQFTRTRSGGFQRNGGVLASVRSNDATITVRP